MPTQMQDELLWGRVVAAPGVEQRVVHVVRAGERHAAGRRRGRLLLQLVRAGERHAEGR